MCDSEEHREVEALEKALAEGKTINHETRKEFKCIEKERENKDHENKNLERVHDKLQSKVENIERLKDEKRRLLQK